MLRQKSRHSLYRGWLPFPIKLTTKAFVGMLELGVPVLDGVGVLVRVAVGDRVKDDVADGVLEMDCPWTCVATKYSSTAKARIICGLLSSGRWKKAAILRDSSRDCQSPGAILSGVNKLPSDPNVPSQVDY